MGTQTYTLVQLAEAVGMSPRNVRAYQARGLIGPPRRRGRGVVYDEEHRGRLERVRDAVTQGVSLKRLAALVAEGRLEELEEVVRRLRPAGATIDLTSAGGHPHAALSPEVADHLERSAADALATLVRLGVVSRAGRQLTAPTALADPLHELFADEPPVLAHALATAAVLAAGHEGRREAGPDAQQGRRTLRVVDLVHRVQSAVVAAALQERTSP